MTDPFPADEERGFDALEDLRSRFKADLKPGERIVWAGRPANRPAFHQFGCLIAAGIAANLFFGAAWASLREYFRAVGRGKQADLLLAFGLAALVIGSLALLGVVSQWINNQIERRDAAKNMYLLTDRRLVVRKPASASRSVEVHSIERGRVADLRRVEHPDETGDLVLALTSLTSDASYYSAEVRLENITNVRDVEDLVRRTLLEPVLTH